MASITYTSFYRDIAIGSIDCDADTFKAMLVTSSYTADKDHAKRNAITNEVTGTGYTAGGSATACTVSLDTANDKVTIDFADVAWAASSITARGAVIYKSRGGLSSADELVGYIDFGADKTSSASTFTLDVTAPLTIQN